MNDQRKDGTSIAKIRIGHKSKNPYLDTRAVVTKTSQVILINVMTSCHAEKHIETVTAGEVKALLEKIDAPSESGCDDRHDTNFLSFCENYITELKKSGRGSTAKTMETVYFSLQDYLNHQDISTTAIR